MRTIDYLDAVKARFCLPSDYKLAEKLGLTRSHISKLRLDKSHLGDDTAIYVAKLLQIEPIKVVAHANIERSQRANDPERLQMWTDLSEKLSKYAASQPV